MSLLGDLGTAIKNKLGGTSVDNTVPRYDGTTCKLQGSGVTISDTNVVTASGGFVGSLTGNASTATTLQTARTINGVAFDGTANITIADSTKLPLAGGTLTGALAGTTFTGTSFNSITGLSSTTPVMNGTAAVGTGTTAARADHVHGSDTTKVSKVTSTDNAIVRFDGTSGAVQNSSVIIDDSGNVGIGTNSPSRPLYVNFSGDSGIYAKSTSSNCSLYLDSGTSSGQYIRMSTNGTTTYWINATSDGNLDFRPNGDNYAIRFAGDGSLYTRDGNTRLEFYRFGTSYYYDHHIKTDVPWENHTQMYSLEFKGHEYGASKSIDARIVWYSYAPTNSPIGIGNDGTHSIGLYRSSDGYVVIKIYMSSGYYSAWTASQYTTNQGLRPIMFTNVTNSSSTTVY